MKQNNNGLIVGIVALLLVGGVLGWLIVSQQKPEETNTQTSPSQNSGEQPPTEKKEDTSASNGQSEITNVEIKDFAFSPASITVKKGTKVTWTNQDTTGHNVVASDSGNGGGLPTSNSLLGKGESYSFTFNEVGTFDYVCAPHASSMKGTVKVVE